MQMLYLTYILTKYDCTEFSENLIPVSISEVNTFFYYMEGTFFIYAENGKCLFYILGKQFWIASENMIYPL